MKAILTRSEDFKYFKVRRKDKFLTITPREDDGVHLCLVAKGEFADVKKIRLGFDVLNFSLSFQTAFELSELLRMYCENNITEEQRSEFIKEYEI
jgi:hypothetical protein